MSIAVAGAIIGDAIRGWLNDKCGRRTAILIADFLFLVGKFLGLQLPIPIFLLSGGFSLALGSGWRP